MKNEIDLATEKGCIEWVELNILLLMRPKKEGKCQLVSPFSSFYAREQVINCLGKELFKMLDETKAVKQ